MERIKDRKYIHIIDFIIYGVSIFACFLVFCHTDLLVTAQNSTMLLEGNWKDFYTSCYELSGGYGANYLPSTFIVFAIWNLPLKLFSMLPRFWGDWNVIFYLWNKLLPSIAFFATAYLLFKLCKEQLKFDVRKSKTAMWIFLTSPIAIYCQFIFSQYDIFTVFLMVLGLNYYFKIDECKKNEWLFIFYFGIAATFKYFSLIYFLVLLLLREKNILRIIRKGLYCLIPVLISGGVYFITDTQSFKRSVLGFDVLNRAQGVALNIGVTPVNLSIVVMCVLLAWAYFTEIKENREWICYAFYFCNGISLSIFALMHWHPQWLIIGVPFWCIAFVLNSKSDVFIWVDLLFGIMFNVLVCNVYARICDESLLRHGILSSLFCYKDVSPVSMADVYHFKDMSIVVAIIVAALVIYFVFNHPNRILRNISERTVHLEGVLRIRFILYIASFAIPVFIAAGSMREMPEVWWSDSSTLQWAALGAEEESLNEYIQKVSLPKGKLESINVTMATMGNTITESSVELLIRNVETGKEIGCSTVQGEEIRDCEEAIFLFSNLKIPKEGEYELVFRAYSSDEEPVLLLGKPDENINIPNTKTVIKNYEHDRLTVNGVYQQDYHLMMSIHGFLQ